MCNQDSPRQREFDDEDSRNEEINILSARPAWQAVPPGLLDCDLWAGNTETREAAGCSMITLPNTILINIPVKTCNRVVD